MEDRIAKVVQLIKKKAKNIDIAEKAREEERFVKSKILAIDWMLGGKGIPLGKLVEVYGDYSSGKSWFCYRMLGRIQKEGFIGVLLDTEGSFSVDWAKKCGINTADLLLFKPFNLEEVFESLFSVLKDLKDERIFVVWDSLAMTPSEKEMDDGFDKRDLTKAQVIGQGLRMILRYMEEKDMTLMVINQLREKIGVIYGETEFTPGGRALGYATSLRIRFWRKGKIKNGEEAIGQKVRVECTKSKVFEPFRWVECEFIFGEGIKEFSGVFDLMKRLNLICGSGGWYYFEGDDKRKWREDDFYEMLLVKDPFLMGMLKMLFGEMENGFEIS